MTRSARRLLAVSLVGVVGMAMLVSSTGFAGTAAGAAGNTAPDCSTVSYSGSGTASDPYEVGTVDQLQCIENQGLGNHYDLTGDIDASGTSQWNEQSSFTETHSTVFSPPTQIQLQHAPIDAGTVTVTDTYDDSDLSFTVVDAEAGTVEVTESSVDKIEVAYETQSPVPFGFEPIGDSNNAFTGEFDGVGHTISGLTIDRPNTDYVGLFGEVESGGTIRNVGVEDGSITGNNDVGGLAGSSLGTVSESYVTTDITGGDTVGGIVGFTEGTVERSSATGSVSGVDRVGGLVGQTFGISPKVSGSYTTGDVSGNKDVGGLVGLVTDATIERSYATGDISGSSNVGGLIGRNADTLSDSYWDKGTTNRGSAVGGAYGTTTGVQGFGSTGDTSPASEMQGSSAASNMGNLDFTSTWETVVSGGDATADGYPVLSALDRQAQLETRGIYNAPPSVSAITRSSPSSPTNADSVDYTVTFSESVSGVDTGDFTATQVSGDVSQVTSVAVNAVTVTVGSISGDGDLQLDLNDDDSITDGNGYELGGTGTSGDTDGSYTSGETYTIDNTAPSVSGVTLADDTDGNGVVTGGETIQLTATVTDANGISSVTADAGAFDAGSVTLADDGPNSASADDQYSATVTVGSSPTEGDQSVSVSATDAAGNGGSQAAASGTLTVDTTAPTLSADSGSTDEDTAATVVADLLSNDNDATALSVSQVEGSAGNVGSSIAGGNGGLFTIASDGTVDFDPNGEFESLASGDSDTSQVTVTVADAAGNTDTQTVEVTVTGVNDSPTAISLTSTAVAQSGGTDAVVGTLSATDVDDSSHTFSLVGGSGDGDNAEFNVDSGDLRADDAGSLADGDYDVRLEADDGNGGTYEQQFTVSVTDDLAPTASVGSDMTIDEGESVSFDGSGSTDNGGIVSYDWDFDDGATATGATTSHTFSTPGTYDVELTVTDAAGNQATAVRTITVESTGGGGGGVSSYSLTADAGDSRTVFVGEDVSFDGSGSAPGYYITSYGWDFGDGESATGERVTHAFNDTGEFPVELTVSGSNDRDTDTATVTVEALDLDAAATATDIDTETDLTVDVTAAQGNRVFTAILYDGDGQTVETTTGRLDANRTATVNFGTRTTTDGPYYAEVTDDETGLSATTDDVAVSEPGTSSVTIEESVIVDQRGDVAEIPLTLERTSTATLTIGTVEDNFYQVNATVRDGDGDGTVVVRFNTYTAGAEENYTVFETVDSADTVVAVDRNDTGLSVSSAQETVLGGDEYQLRSVGGAEAAHATPDGEDDIATLSLQERSTDENTARDAPSGTSASDLDEIQRRLDNGTLTESSTVVSEEVLVTELAVSGLEGPLRMVLADRQARNVTDAFLTLTANHHEAASAGVEDTEPVVDLQYTQTNAGANRIPHWLGANHTTVDIVPDYGNDTYYVVYHLSETTTPADGDQYETNFTVLDTTDLADDPQEVRSNWTYEDAAAAVDTDADDQLTLRPEPNQEIPGTTNVAPGTRLTVRVRGTDTSAPFIEPLETTVDPDGTFVATGDFSERAAGTNYTVEVRREGTTLSDTIDGRFRSGGTASVTFADQASDGQSVTVDSVTTTDGGFVAVFADGQFRGVSDYLESGSRRDVEITVAEPLTADTTLEAVVYRDINNDRVWNASATDRAYTADGEPVARTATVTFGPETPTEMPEIGTGIPTAETTGAPEQRPQAGGNGTGAETITVEDGPGFGVVSALVGLVMTALLGTRRR